MLLSMHGSTWLRSLGAVGALAIVTSGYADTFWYVDDDAAPAGDGLTWATGYRFLQDALAVAVAGDEIHVAQGAYYPDEDELNPHGTGDREATFALNNGVTMLGGFAGLGAEDPDERDPVAYVTVLSGDLLGDDEPEFVNYEENSYHVVTISSAEEAAVIDGFTVTAGNAEETNGGGTLAASSSRFTIRDCTFVANIATAPDDEGQGGNGGGIDIGVFSTSIISSCTFEGNRAVGGLRGGGRGGGMNIGPRVDALVTACRFANNSVIGGGMSPTGTGGGMSCAAMMATIEDCVFESNTATAAGDGNHAGLGGGLFTSSPELVVRGCEFRDNVAIGSHVWATGFGGGAWIFNPLVATIERCIFARNTAVAGTADITGAGGGIYIDGNQNVESDTALVRDCLFVGNVSEQGYAAAAVFTQLSGTIMNCTFIGNAATDGPNQYSGLGSGINLGETDARVMNCTFAANTAAKTGGGMLIVGDALSSSSPTLTNCTFVGNSAPSGAAFTSLSIDGEYPSDIRVRNCILWNDGPEVANLDGSTIEISYSDVEGGYEGVGNIDSDPLITRAPDPGDDGEWGTEDDDYGDLSLQLLSPATDAGANNAVPRDEFDLDEDGDTDERLSLDLDGNLRFADNLDMADTGCGEPVHVDMGAYEYQGEPWHPMLVGDIDGDGTVAFPDLLAVLAAWGACDPECCLADIDFSGEVDFDDLLKLLANWS